MNTFKYYQITKYDTAKYGEDEGKENNISRDQQWDHWHVYNPYPPPELRAIDINGYPVKNGVTAAHLFPHGKNRYRDEENKK